LNARLTGLPANRWYIYQQERFPLLANGLLIAAFSSSAVCYSALLRGGTPTVISLIVAFATALLLFLQLRIADEFKDFEEDRRYRPYRPVQRGLVTLRELAVIGAVGALVQLALAAWLAPGLIPLLFLTWGYLALMTREFFVREWIVQRPITYLWTHMLIMPLADFYATACDWQVATGHPPAGLAWFIGLSFFNGVTIELGRKIRAPHDEEEGVRTYSFLWGRKTAVLAWWGALIATAVCAVNAAARIGTLWEEAITLGILVAIGLILGARFLAQPVTKRAKWIEHFSGLWTLVLYLSLGLLPLLWRWKEVAS
jgi:hypothetical protein